MAYLRLEGVTALGSGFVYDNQGHIITNFHVIEMQIMPMLHLQMEIRTLQKS